MIIFDVILFNIKIRKENTFLVFKNNLIAVIQRYHVLTCLHLMSLKKYHSSIAQKYLAITLHLTVEGISCSIAAISVCIDLL